MRKKGANCPYTVLFSSLRPVGHQEALGSLPSWCLGLSGGARLPVRQPLALDARQRDVGALAILNPKPDTVVVAEVEFREVAV